MSPVTAVRADVFPAELVGNPDAPDPRDRTRVYPVRVVVTMDEVLVWEESGRSPRLVFRDRLASYSPPTPAHRATREARRDGSFRWAALTTDSGHAIAFARASGCGCGSRLKALSLRSLLDGLPDASASPSASSTPIAASKSDR